MAKEPSKAIIRYQLRVASARGRYRAAVDRILEEARKKKLDELRKKIHGK